MGSVPLMRAVLGLAGCAALGATLPTAPAAPDLLQSAHPGTVEIRVGRDRPLPGQDRGLFTEPAIASHPGDADGLAVVAIEGFTRTQGAPGWRCRTWHSADRGSTWASHTLAVPMCSDPTIVVTNDGTVHTAVLRDGVTVFRSRLGSAPERVATLPGSDHPVLVLAGRSVLLVSTRSRTVGGTRSSGLWVMSSADGGRSYERVAEVQRAGLISNALRPAALGDGRLVFGEIEFAQASGGQNQLVDPPVLWSLAAGGPAAAPASRVEVSRACQGRVGFPQIVGGARRAYAVCVARGAEDILVFASSDGGQSWSAPRGVLGGSDPRFADGTRIQRDTPVLRRAVGAAVNGDGSLGIIWQDRSDDRQRRCQALHFSMSVDGGVSFSAPVSVSSAPSCPENPQNREGGAQWPAGTDYGALAAAADGSFVAAWADARDGAYRIWTARIDVDSRD